ncbi:MAG: FG-GAP repeat protein [Gammaproteobacteria bacterium]
MAYHARLRGSGLTAENREHGYAIDFRSRGLEIVAGSGRFKLALAGVGYGDRLQAVQRVSPKTQANRVEYPRGVLTEWYVNGPLELEQGFTLEHRPAGAQEGPLTLALDLSGTIELERTGQKYADAFAFCPRRRGRAAHRGLTALDAGSRQLPARLALTDGTLKIEVDERNAAYPLTIDPFIERAKLTASDAAAGDSFGESVAMSGNGKLAVIGAAFADCAEGEACGAAYVFVRKGNKWVEQQKLTASDGTAFDGFGEPVALSADGKTGAYPTQVCEGEQDNGEEMATNCWVSPRDKLFLPPPL